MRNLLATGAGFLAAVAVLWKAGDGTHTDSALVGAAVVVGVLAAKVVGAGLSRLVAAHRHIDGVQADAMAGVPIMHWHTTQGRRDQAILDVATDAQVQL